MSRLRPRGTCSSVTCPAGACSGRRRTGGSPPSSAWTSSVPAASRSIWTGASSSPPSTSPRASAPSSRFSRTAQGCKRSSRPRRAPCRTIWSLTPGAASTSPISGAPQPTRRAASITSRRTSGRSRPCCRAWRWRAALRSARTERSCGPRSSAGTSCTGWSWRTRRGHADRPAVPYHFTGPAPDSMRADADGNVDVAMFGQAGCWVDRNGILIGQVCRPAGRRATTCAPPV